MNLLKWKPLSRRTVLRGAYRGLGLSLALPTLHAMQPRRAAAQAAPRRFLAVIVPSGLDSHRARGAKLASMQSGQRDRWTPQNTGSGWVMTTLLQPFANLRNDVTILSGIDVPQGRNWGHEGHAAILSIHDIVYGNTQHDSAANGRTIDFAIADKIGGTKFPCLTVGAFCIGSYNQGFSKFVSYTAPRAASPPENNPQALFQRIFTDVGSGGGTQVDPALARLQAERRSMLDGIKANLDLYKKRLGVEDRARLDLHLSQVRAIENRLTAIAAPAPGVGCSKPAQPPSLGIQDETKIGQIVDLQRELITMAFVCDLTRSVSFNFGGSASTAHFFHLRNNLADRHGITHGSAENPNDKGDASLAAQTDTDTYNNKVIADTVAMLKATREGAGTLLDSTVVLGTSEIAGGSSHNFGGYRWRDMNVDSGTVDGAWILAGLPGVFKHGSHLRYKDRMGTFKQLLQSAYEATTGLSGPAAQAWQPAGANIGPLPGLQGDATSALQDFPAPF